MITSMANAQVKQLVVLGKKGKERAKQGLFVVEGKKMLKEAPKEWIKKIYIAEFFSPETGFLEQFVGFAMETLSDAVFQAVSDTKTPQGILGVLEMPKWDLQKMFSDSNACFLLLEGIQDPGNLGTMLRMGEAAGVTAVIADKTTADVFHPKTVRSTMGSVYRMPFFAVEDFHEMLFSLKRQGIAIYAACLQGKRMYDEPDYKGNCAFLIGNEGNGLKGDTLALADEWIRIPMEGSAESLNAAVAAAVLAYEANRQRRREKNVSVMGKRD